VRQRRLRHVEVAEDVGPEGFLEALLGEVLDRFGVLLEGGVVDHHVEPAERLDRLRHHLLRELRLLDVARHEHAAAALGLDAAAGLFGIESFVEVGDGHVRTLAREQHGDSAADAGIGAGDDGRESFELAAAAVVRRKKPGREREFRLVAGLGDVLSGQLSGLATRAGLHRLLLVFAPLRLACLIAPILLGLDAALPTRGRSRRRRVGRAVAVAARAPRAHCVSAEEGVEGARCGFMAVAIVKFARSGNGCARAPATARSRLPSVDPASTASRLAGSSQCAR
jgi:hypothetical protein